MKISEMTNDMAAQALIRLSEPISNICDDDDMLKLLDEVQGMKDEIAIRAIAKLIPKFVAFGIVKHKKDLYEIVGALMMEPTSKVGGMNFVQTIQALEDSYDDVLASFFTRSVKQAKNSEES